MSGANDVNVSINNNLRTEFPVPMITAESDHQAVLLNREAEARVRLVVLLFLAAVRKDGLRIFPLHPHRTALDRWKTMWLLRPQLPQASGNLNEKGGVAEATILAANRQRTPRRRRTRLQKIRQTRGLPLRTNWWRTAPSVIKRSRTRRRERALPTTKSLEKEKIRVALRSNSREFRRRH